MSIIQFKHVEPHAAHFLACRADDQEQKVPQDREMLFSVEACIPAAYLKSDYSIQWSKSPFVPDVPDKSPHVLRLTR